MAEREPPLERQWVARLVAFAGGTKGASRQLSSATSKCSLGRSVSADALHASHGCVFRRTWLQRQIVVIQELRCTRPHLKTDMRQDRCAFEMRICEFTERRCKRGPIRATAAQPLRTRTLVGPKSNTLRLGLYRRSS